MSNNIAPNLSYHYWFLGVIGEELETEADPLVLVRGSEFTPDKEIQNEDDEGHMGTATTRISTYRSSASASPSYTDKTRYKEGWEDTWYLLLGSADETTGDIRKTTKTTGVYEYTFAVNTQSPQDPAFATLYNGFAKSEDGDTFKYENCLLNEFEISGSNEEAPTYTNTFASNFPKFNQPNIARTLPAYNVFTKPSGVTIYIAPKGDYTLSSIEQYKYPCFIDYSLSVNRNVETQPCSSDDFGTSTKVLGNLEAELRITFPWTDATKHLEYTFMGGAADSTEVTDANDEKTVWIVFESGNIGSTQYKYQTIIKIPEIVLTNADSPQSGSDAKQIELEGNIVENGSDSFIETIVTTDLADLHIHNPTPSSP